MKLSRLSIGLLASLGIVITFFTSNARVSSQTSASPELCRARFIEELGKVHDTYRAHVFGAREGGDDGLGVLLSGGSVSGDAIGKGIFETKGRLSSELIEPIVESYRVLRCRSIAICNAMKASNKQDGETPLTIDTLGCAAETIDRYAECRKTKEDLTMDIPHLVLECGRTVARSLAAERATLRLALSYDSGYRASLQLGGMIDWMQEDAPTAVLAPLQSMVNMLGKLHEIPCFIGQCDDPRPSTISE